MIRLDKLLSNLGYCSRKEVGRLVKTGSLTRSDGSRFKKASDKVEPEEVRLVGQPLEREPVVARLRAERRQREFRARVQRRVAASY